jgi:hypothetical protein
VGPAVGLDVGEEGGFLVGLEVGPVAGLLVELEQVGIGVGPLVGLLAGLDVGDLAGTLVGDDDLGLFVGTGFLMSAKRLDCWWDSQLARFLSAGVGVRFEVSLGT